MLHALRIENYAIIQNVDIQFDTSLNIITGETGAGKSILLGALGLIMGERADSSVLYDKQSKCFVEAVFRDYPQEVDAILREQDYDVEDELIIRREISHSGKSRAFVNDSPSRLDLLQALSSLLVDLNSQFELTSIRDTRFQLELIDAFAENGSLRDGYSTGYKELTRLSKELDQLQAEESQQIKEMDFKKFQYEELSQAELNEKEQDDLESELAMLERAEEIALLMKETAYLIAEDDNAVRSQMNQLRFKWEEFASIDAGIAEASELFSQLEDFFEQILEKVDVLSTKLEADPQRLSEIEERLNIIYGLQRKHQVKDIRSLIEITSELEHAIEQFDSNSSRIEELRHLKKEKAAELENLATKLSNSRKAVFSAIEKRINSSLNELAMPSAEIKVYWQKRENYGPTGMDDIQILFKANKGAEFMPIKKVASGGETARLMLALKSTVAHAMSMPTMIFDEIDTGVSGEVANRMAEILKGLSGEHQLICITHTPQVAARAVRHFFVYKEDKANRTITHVRILEGAERVNEIAKMLSGDPPTAYALENARELIG